MSTLYVHRDLFEHNPRMAPFITYITRMPEEKRQQLIEKAEEYLASIGKYAGMSNHPPGERTGGSIR